MKGWQVGLVTVGISAMMIAHAQAQTNASVVIGELQTGSAATTSEDFVELYNQTSQEIDLTTWRLEYMATSATSQWTKKAQLVGSIPAHGTYLVATSGYLEDLIQATFTSGLSKTGGSLRLVKVGQKGGEDEVIDLVGWGTAITFEGDKAAPSPADGESLVRHMSDERLLDTDQNLVDFSLTDTPSPASSGTSVSPDPDPDPDPDEGTDGSEQPGDPDEPEAPSQEAPEGNVDVWISELLVDPASPQTDAEDEYIELYNAGSTSADLRSFVLQTGLTYNHSYQLQDVVLAPGQYIALTSSVTGLALSNSGGRARLVDVNGEVIYETPVYEAAKVSQAFALGLDGSWQWTESPSPGQANTIVVAIVPEKTPTEATTKSPVKPKTPTKSSTKKTTSTKAKKVTTKTTKAPTQPATSPLTQSASPRLSSKWLVALGSGTLLYGAYEYRTDIGNTIHQLRRHRFFGRKDRS